MPGFEDSTSSGVPDSDAAKPVSSNQLRQFMTELRNLIERRKLVILYTNTVEVGKDPKRLIDRSYPCDFVILSLANATGGDPKSPTRLTQDGNNSYSTANQEVYWGSDAVCVHQIFPQQTTGFIPVRDARDIFVQLAESAPDDTQVVGFSVFKYEDEK
jgi:hypothetical protein